MSKCFTAPWETAPLKSQSTLRSFRPAILTINWLSTNMITVVKSKLPIVIPATVQRRAGLKAGDRVEFRVSGNIITVQPETVAKEEDYTSAQRRRLIDARLAEARKGPHYGPFDSVAEMQADIESRIKKISLTKTRRKL